MTETTTSHSAPQARRLERSRSDRKVAGVAGGLAEYFDLDPVVYRVAFVVLTLIGGSGLLLYVAAALVIPDAGKQDSIAGEIIRNRREQPWALIGLGLLALAGLAFLDNADLWPNGDGLWVVLAILGAIILWRQRRAGRPRNWLRVTLGVLTALIVAVVAAATVAAFSVGNVTDGVGERTYHVSSANAIEPRYKLGVGRLDLDLTEARLRPGTTTRVSLELGVGELHVAAPAGTLVRYHADVHAGNVVVSGAGVERDGWRVGETGVLDTGAGANAPVLDVRADVSAGEFRLDRTP